MGIPAPQGVGASGLPPAGDQANAVVSGVIGAVGPTQPFAFRGPMNLAAWAAVSTALTTTAGSLNASVASATGIAIGYNINSANVPAGTTIKTLAGTNLTLAIPPITLTASVDGSDLMSGLISTTGLIGATVTGQGVPAATTVLQIVQAAVAPTNLSPGVPGIVRLSNLTTGLAYVGPQPYTFARTGNAVVTTGADAASTFTGSGANFTGSFQVERSFDGGQTWLVCNIGGSGTLAVYNAGTPVNLVFGEPEKQVLYRLNCTALSAGTINYRLSETGGAAESLAIGPLI